MSWGLPSVRRSRSSSYSKSRWKRSSGQRGAKLEQKESPQSEETERCPSRFTAVENPVNDVELSSPCLDGILESEKDHPDRSMAGEHSSEVVPGLLLVMTRREWKGTILRRLR